MQGELLDRTVSRQDESRPGAEEASSEGVVLLKSNSTSEVQTTIPHAMAVAQALGRKVRLVQVVGAGEAAGIPVDPVEWDLKKRQAQVRLTELEARYGHAGCPTDTRIVQRFLPSLIGGCHDPDHEPIFCFARHEKVLPWDREDELRRFMHSGCSSVLLVPENVSADCPASYRRLLVMLDGSSRAERVLPAAVALSRFHGAELLFVHVTPDAGLTVTGPLEPEALDLRKQVMLRNRRVASQYLANIRSRVESQALPMTTRVLEGGDVRHKLIEVVKDTQSDLVLIASQGTTGHADVATGTVARFVLENAQVPVLMIGREYEKTDARLYSDVKASAGLRANSTMA
ncbi:MAG: universal stress protein [Granulosicoccus sp.]|nr:universal stress protein [Granulosicoccus sp.]